MNKFLAATLALSAAVSVSGLAQSPVTIQYGTWDATRRPVDEKVIKAFEAANPSIKVKYNLVPWDQYWEKAAAMTAGGVTFDAMWMNLDNLPQYVSQGALSSIPLSDADRKAIPTKTISPYMTGDGTYGLPLGPQAVSVYINKKLFKERGVPIPTSGWTFDQMLAAAKRLTFQKGNKKIWGINGQDLQPDTEYGMSFFYTMGGSSIIKKTEAGYVANLDANFKKSAQWLHDLVFKHKVAPTPKDISLQGYQLFLADQLGIYVEGTWMTAVWPENKKLEWAFAPFPTMKAGEAPKAVFSAHALVVPNSAKQKEAAITFAKWVTTAKAAQQLLAQNGLFPTAAETYKAPFLQSLPNRNGETIFKQLQTSVLINDDVRLLSNLPEVLGALYEDMNLAWTGNSTLDAAITKASASMDKLLKKAKVLEMK